MNERGLVLVGCGKMGSALLRGWLSQGLDPQAVFVVDPYPTAWLAKAKVQVNVPLPDQPAVVVVAVKPQMMGAVLPDLRSRMTPQTLCLSVAAGTPISRFEEAFGPNVPLVRSMPNTPAAIGAGVAAIVGNGAATAADWDLAETLMRAVGQVVRLDTEAQMDAVTGLSGSGPAYVFHLIEALRDAGLAEGLPAPIATELACATVAGAGALAAEADVSAAQLRENVTSPNGTTQAALEVLMSEQDGLRPLIARTVSAAVKRSKELARE